MKYMADMGSISSQLIMKRELRLFLIERVFFVVHRQFLNTPSFRKVTRLSFPTGHKHLSTSLVCVCVCIEGV